MAQSSRYAMTSDGNETPAGVLQGDDIQMMKKDVMIIRDELGKVSTILKGKTPQEVTSDRKFSRDVLIDALFSVKNSCLKSLEIAGKLIDKHEKSSPVNPDNTTDTKNDVVEMVKKLLPDIIASTVQCLKKQTTEPEKAEVVTEERHVVLLEQNTPESDGATRSFTKEQWSKVVKNDISGRLQNVPITKSVLTKEGKGCVVVPTKQAQDQVKEALKDNFIVTADTNNQKKLLPKLKICDIDTNIYSKTETVKLREAIIRKNHMLSQMITSKELTLDVIFIHEKENYCVIKVSPEIRKHIIQTRKIFIDLSSHYVKDQIHLTQCFACQQYGHKKGSRYCEAEVGKYTCLYCAGEHQSKYCKNKKDKSKHNCANCLNSKIPSLRQTAAGHTTTSQQCPIVIRETKNIVNRTAGIDPKNFLVQRTINKV